MTPPTPARSTRRAAPLEPFERDVLARFEAGLPPREWTALRYWVGEFWPFQRRWLLDPSDFAVCLKARQIGLSLSSGAVAVLWGAFLGETSTIVSQDEDRAKEVLESARRHARVLRALGSTMADTLRSNANEIVFDGGGRVIALDSKGSRSYSGNVFLDEYAYHPNAAAVWEASSPSTLLGSSRVRVLSTPNGVGNEFHGLWEIATSAKGRARNALLDAASKRRWSAHRIPMSLAIEQGYPVDVEKCWMEAKNDPRLFAQFFECSFLDGELQYIPTALLDARQVDAPPSAQSLPSTSYWAGLDIGREVDLTALVVVRQDVGPKGVELRVVHVETIKRTELEAVMEMVAAAFAKYKLRRICVDKTGVGSFPADEIKRRHSERYDPSTRRPRVDNVDFTLKTKDEMATALYSALSDGRLMLPASDAAIPTFERERADGTKTIVNEPGTAEAIRREVASIQRKVTRAANVTYETPRTSDGHADRAWALMLAVRAVDAPHPLVVMRGGAR